MKERLITWTAGIIAILSLSLGWLYPHPLIGLVGSLGLLYVLVRMWVVLRRVEAAPEAEEEDSDPRSHHPREVLDRPPADPNDHVALARAMLDQGRYTLLLRPQIAGNIDPTCHDHAIEMLNEAMALVPDGDVVLGQVRSDPDDYEEEEPAPAKQGRVVRVAALFLDRYPVTNRQYYEFVAAGGYQQPSLWEPTILPAVLHFVDQTGEPGPRYWKHGCYARGLDRHPVVGVSWFEAAAYARWVGKRLPTDAEWVKAGSWPVNLAAARFGQRRYPWGDMMDRRRAHLWGDGPRTTVSVDDFECGVSIGGVHQLIGNVWEWMRGAYTPPEDEGEWIIDVPLRSIRGGAFDTYLDTQATCQFQSGEVPISRKDNIGFRCAVSLCDLALSRDALPTVEGSPRPEEVCS